MCKYKDMAGKGLLKWSDQISVPETAKLLNCKVSTVKQRLVRGKKLLHVQLFERGEQ